MMGLDDASIKLLTLFVAIAALMISIVSAVFSWRTSQSSIKSNDFKIVVDFSKEIFTRWKNVSSSLHAFEALSNDADNAAREKSEFAYKFELGELLNYLDILCGMINRSSIPKKSARDVSVIIFENIYHVFSDAGFVAVYKSLRHDSSTFCDLESFVEDFWKNNSNASDALRQKHSNLCHAVRKLTQV